MDSLATCVYCGKTVSKNAAQCPKCNHPPNGYSCLICEKPIQSAAQLAQIKHNHKWVHLNCIKEIRRIKELNEKGLCPACANKLSYENVIKNNVGSHYCKNCGHPIKRLENCHFCGELLYDGLELSFSVYAHHVCYQVWFAVSGRKKMEEKKLQIKTTVFTLVSVGIIVLLFYLASRGILGISLFGFFAFAGGIGITIKILNESYDKVGAFLFIVLPIIIVYILVIITIAGSLGLIDY